VVTGPGLLPRLLRADRFIQARLQASGRPHWSDYYRRLRGRVRMLLG
jgi:hypothetical protein